MIHSQIFVQTFSKYDGTKLPKILAGIVAQKNSEQATCFQAFLYRKCMKNIGKNAFFAKIVSQVNLYPNISPKKMFLAVL